MYQNMMGSPGAPFGGQQVNNMGQQPVRNDRMGYAPGGMPQQNPNYAQLGQGVSNQFNQYGQMGQQLSGHLPGYGSMGQQISGQMPFGGAVQPGGMDYLRGQFGGGYRPGDMSKYFGGGGFNAIMPNNDAGFGQPTIDSWHNRPTYGGAPQPDTGALDNPEMQNPFRTFNNGNPFYNAKGNLRMRYR